MKTIKKYSIFFFMLCFMPLLAQTQRIVTDVTGREVSIPLKVDRVFAMSAIGSLYLYALAPEKLIGWNYTFNDAEKKFLLPEVHKLPNLGGAGGTAVNYEQLLVLKPDVIVMFQFQDKERAEDIERKTGIPVLVFDNELSKIPSSLEVLGEILGEEQRARALVEYAKETLLPTTIPENKKISMYYAEGKNGLFTEPPESDHAEVLTIAGAKNVAQIPAKQSQTAVSLEQVIMWNPSVIISWADSRGGYASGIKTDARWQGIDAVKKNRVYAIPNAPFNWVDRPYSVNRLLGVRWIRSLLYPSVYTESSIKIVQDFYKLFYHYNLSEEQAKSLLQLN